MRSRSTALVWLLLTWRVAMPDSLLQEDFEKPGKWTKRIKGKGSIELVDGGFEGKCVRIVATEPGVHYYTIKLDPKRVRGKRLTIRGKVRVENVAQGPQSYSTAKFHVGGRVGRTAYNRATWFVGTKDWFDAVLIADVPEDITNPVFDVAIQGTTGTAYFDSLTIDDGMKAHMPLDLKLVANTSYSDGVADDGAGGFIDTGALDMRNLPTGDVILGEVEFRLMIPGANSGATCVALKGAKRPHLPAAPKPVKKPGQGVPVPAVVPVKHKAAGLVFLQAAGWIDASRKAPCLIYTVRYADGETLDVPIIEGIDIGAFDAPKDLPNWKVVWTDTRWGKAVGLGATRWTNPRPTIKIESVSLRSPGTGAVPIVAAITADRKGK